MITVGVIGYGYWGPNLVRNFSEVPGARVGAVSDLNPARLAKVKERYPGVTVTTDYRELLADPKIDAVAIATPVSTHFNLAQQALEAGRHVFVEKPITDSVEHAQQLIETAERTRKVLMVDHTFIYTGAVRKVRELLDAGELGHLYYYDSVRVNLGLFQHDINVLWDLAAHDLSIMDFLLGQEPTAISATGIAHVAGQPENIAYLTCFFPNQLIAHFHVNWLSPVKVRRTLISGDRRMVVYDDLEPSEKIKVYDRGLTLNSQPDSRYQMLIGYRSGDMCAPQLNMTEALQVEARHFVECIDQGKKPLSDGAAGLRVVRVLEAANASLLERGQVIEL